MTLSQKNRPATESEINKLKEDISALTDFLNEVKNDSKVINLEDLEHQNNQKVVIEEVERILEDCKGIYNQLFKHNSILKSIEDVRKKAIKDQSE